MTLIMSTGEFRNRPDTCILRSNATRKQPTKKSEMERDLNEMREECWPVERR